MKSTDKNSFHRDITFPTCGYSCESADMLSLANVEIVIGLLCCERVHPMHMSVFYFTHCMLDDTLPGNIVAKMEDEPNPIKKLHDIMGTIFLTNPSFPSGDVPSHPIERWNIHSVHFSKLGWFVDVVEFVDLPNELRTWKLLKVLGSRFQWKDLVSWCVAHPMKQQMTQALVISLM